MIHKPKWFKIYELVDPQTYHKFGDDKSWWFITPEVVQFIDLMRDTYGKIIINDWFWGGSYKWSGFRTPESPDYSYWSQHSRGNATDMKFQDVTVEEVREDLKERWNDYGVFPITIEKDVGWLHADFRTQNRLYNEF